MQEGLSVWEAPAADAAFTQELVKHTQDALEKENLRLALDAMRVSDCGRPGARVGPGGVCRARLTPPRPRTWRSV